MSQCDKCQNDTHWTTHFCDVCGVICDECHNKCAHKVKPVSSRRNFLKKLGIGAASAPVAIKSLGDQKAKAYHEKMPEYKGGGFDVSEDCVSSSAEHGYAPTYSEKNGYYLYDIKSGQEIWRRK